MDVCTHIQYCIALELQVQHFVAIFLFLWVNTIKLIRLDIYDAVRASFGTSQ